VRRAIVDAAAELFASRGYTGTGTREIAARADVFEPAIYKNFGSKEKLFSAAVAEPFTEFVSRFEESFNNSHGDDAKLTEVFVEQLYTNLYEHRNALTAFIISTRDPSAAVATGLALVQVERMFATLERLGEEWDTSAGRGYQEGRLLMQRLMVGTVLAAVAFEEWIFPTSTDPSAVKHTLTSLLRDGVLPTMRPPD
jgi:AcrR family transcriptional regulator